MLRVKNKSMQHRLQLINLLLAALSLCLYSHALSATEVRGRIVLDESRNRKIPIVIYHGKASKKPVVIISHGYGVKNTEYSFIATSLAEHDYYVASIQHDLETDPPLPNTGNLFERRTPLWKRGVQTILFVIGQLQKSAPHLHARKVILIGHSNGGDMSMMFAQTYPEMVSKVISLDSRRYPFSRNANIKILRFGAVDDEPDEGVVPDNSTHEIYVRGAHHIDLCDRGSAEIKDEIQKSILRFLDEEH